MEVLTKGLVLKSQKYAKKMGRQLLIYRGRGGSGKTVQLVCLANQLYQEEGARVLVLTFNRTLAADIRRLLALMGIRNSIAERSIAVSTVHELLRTWMTALEIVQPDIQDFSQRYEQLKGQLLSDVRDSGLSRQDLFDLVKGASQDLVWDYVMVDESQDWPRDERDIIYSLYGHERVVLADGIDQLVRSIKRTDWREHLNRSDTQVVSLHRSLRMKSSLCDFVLGFAEELGIMDWDLQPLPDVHGGRIVLADGPGLPQALFEDVWKGARRDGNSPVDVLICVPDSAGDSNLSIDIPRWGYHVWDGSSLDAIDSFPTNPDEFRIVPFSLCRGLEGWTAINYGLDEFYDRCLQDYGSMEQRSDETPSLDTESPAEVFAKRWMLIPLTRGIDTLVLHVNDRHHYIGKVLKRLARRFPDTVEWWRE